MDHKTLLLKHLGQASPDPNADTSFYAEDVIAEFPYAPEGHTRELQGVEAVVAFMRRIPTFAEGFALGEPTIHATDEGFIAEYSGDATFKSTGRSYAQDYVSVITVRDGRIAKIREYYDPVRVLRAIGDLD